MLKPIKIDIKKLVKDLDVGAKRLVSTRMVGRYRTVFISKGVEFEEYREYTPQDDAKEIDWKASVRTNKTLMKQYKEERNLNLFFILDTSNNMLFGSSAKLKNEYAASLAASLAYMMFKAGDNFGYALFNSNIKKVSLPSPGKFQFYNLLKSLSEPSNYGGTFNIGDILKFLFNLLEKNTVVMIISDFIGIDRDNEWIDTFRLFSKKFDVIAIMVRDIRDEELPEDTKEILLEDNYSGRTVLIDSSLIRKKYKNYVKKEEENLIKVFSKEQADFLKLTTDKSFIPPIIDFFKRRSARLSMAL